MTPGDVLWIFFLFSSLQPVLKQRLLEASRQRLIARIERQLPGYSVAIHKRAPNPAKTISTQDARGLR